MNSYNILINQIFHFENYKIVPIRNEDRFVIMKWRNEQIYHLRQDKPLQEVDQNNYFQNILSKDFNENQPKQILFSFLEDDKCIGYGGLVHINWIDKNAEISFIMNSSLEEENFDKFWSIYLKLIEKVGFNDLKFRKIYVYAFDLRPHLYSTLLKNDYFLDGRLKDHCFFEGEFRDVIIHSKINE